MSSLENVKDIDEQTKNCIFGYVREIQETMPNDDTYYTIPSLVIHWILLYYYLHERFDSNNCGKKLSITGPRSRTIVSKTDNYDIALLSNPASSGVHRWKFKTIKVHPSHFTFVIGVWDTKYSVDVNGTMFSAAVKNKLYGLIDPGVIECSPPKINGNLFSESNFSLISDN